MFSSSIKPETIEKMELASFTGEIHLIEQQGKEYDAALRYLRAQKVIGFDTETRPCFTPQQPHNKVALLQLSGKTKAFLFRLHSLGVDQRMADLLANKNIIKVGAAVHDDIRGLQAYCKFTAGGFVDLQKIVEQWGIKDKSVKKMAAIILGIRISKTQQLSNWEAVQLSESQLKYAATDAWVCRQMYMRLMKTPKPEILPEL